jgi:hypothetical protein
MQRNQASDAISKNSKMAAGALQACSIPGSDFKSVDRQSRVREGNEGDETPAAHLADHRSLRHTSEDRLQDRR